MLQTNGIHKASNRRNKRLLDLVISLLLLVTFPLTIWWVRRKAGYLSNLVAVAFGRKSWVGYDTRFALVQGLPRIAPGVLHPAIGLPAGFANSETSNRLNVIYARDYRLKNDLSLVLKNIASLGE